MFFVFFKPALFNRLWITGGGTTSMLLPHFVADHRECQPGLVETPLRLYLTTSTLICHLHLLFLPETLAAWTQYLNVCVCVCVCVRACVQEADGDDRLGLQGDAEGESDSKSDAPDVPLSTDNTPQYLNKALEGLPPRYTGQARAPRVRFCCGSRAR